MDWNRLGEKLALGLSKTVTYSQPLFGTFDETTVIQPKEIKERRKNTTNKNVPMTVTQMIQRAFD